MANYFEGIKPVTLQKKPEKKEEEIVEKEVNKDEEKEPEEVIKQVKKPKKAEKPVNKGGRPKTKEGNYKPIKLALLDEDIKELDKLAEEYTGGNRTKMIERILRKYIEENKIED